MNNPEWTPIPGFTGYEFHPVLGVRSYRRRGPGETLDYGRAPHLLAQYPVQGIPHVRIRDDRGKFWSKSLRSLIGLAFGRESMPPRRKPARVEAA